MRLTAYQILQKKKINELEDIAIETISHEHREKREIVGKRNRSSVKCETTSNCLMCV